MAVIVQKYGGSSVADVERLQAVADKVVAAHRAGQRVVVVVSAMGGTTDGLLSLARQIDETPPRRELDMLVSTGERVAMALLSMAIQKRGVDAISFTGSQSGIITNDRHFDARIIEVRPFRVEDELARGRVVIVAGFQGMSYKREITTLGRGGSDTTAIAMAAALGADRAEIYSDVDGVYSADPRVVPDAAHLPELTYEEMEGMAQAGAKVLHAAAVAYAREHRIAIHARRAAGAGGETVVSEAAQPAARAAVVGRRGLAEVRLSGGAEALASALAACRACGAIAAQTRLRGASGGLVVAADGPDWATVRARVAAALPDAHIAEGLGLVSVVSGSADTPQVVDASLRALRSAGVDVWDVASAPHRLAFLLDADAVDGAVRSVHAALAPAGR
ncbi:MAG: aspartate kinase [Sandaracinaceae bacterium]